MGQADSETSLFLLNPPISEEEYRKKLWGSVVVEPCKPIDAYSTFRKRSTIEIDPSIDTSPQIIHGYSEIIKWSQRGSADASVENIFKAYFGVSQSAVNFRSSTTASWYYMDATKERLADLCKNEEWTRDVLEFRSKNPGKELLFVTAALVVTDFVTARGQASGKQGGIGVSVPNPQDGTNIVKVGVDAEKDNFRALKAKFADPQIIALGYHAITLTKEVSEEQKRAFWPRIRRFFGRDPKYTSHVVGTLHMVDVDNYIVDMDPRMKPGNVKFLEDESEDEQVDKPSGNPHIQQADQEDQARDEQGEKLRGGKIAIYFPNKSTVTESS